MNEHAKMNAIRPPLTIYQTESGWSVSGDGDRYPERHGMDFVDLKNYLDGYIVGCPLRPAPKPSDADFEQQIDEFVYADRDSGSAEAFNHARRNLLATLCAQRDMIAALEEEKNAALQDPLAGRMDRPLRKERAS